MDRLDRNLTDYHAHMKGFGKAEIIEMAGQISAVSDVHFYLQNHHVFEPEQIDYLLKFDDPLQIVADAWRERNGDISDMSFTLHEIFDKQDALQNYPLAAAGKSQRAASEQRASVRALLKETAQTAKKQNVKLNTPERKPAKERRHSPER